MFYNNAQDTRQAFYQSWQKYRSQERLSSLEQQLVQVIIEHPEYQKILEQNHLDHPYFPEMGQTNPFLHMGLHLAIRDQINTDRPIGISSVYRQLLHKYIDPLIVEHLMLDRLAESLWQAQRTQSCPNENDYLCALKRLLI